jgi:GT2 family glycosyltransferase/glycosyltransferase involved in cell wall biosynthesis/Tfp pilus assembly protein PilF
MAIMSASASHPQPLFPALPTDGSPCPRPLRICIASFDLVGPIRNGGVGTAFTSLGEALAAAGHEVTFLYLSGSFCENGKLEHWIEHYRRKGIRFIPMPDQNGPRLEAPWHMAKSYEAYQWLSRQDFDLIHFSEWRAPGYYTLLAKHQGLAFGSTMLCVHTHGPTLWSLLSNGEYLTQITELELDFMERESVRLADVVVSPSQYLFRWMRQQGWALPERCYVQQYVKPAGATPASSEGAAGQPCPVSELVFFGRLEVRKGLVLFCDALDKLKYDSELRSLRITFLGKLSNVLGRPGDEYLRARAKEWPWPWQIIADRDQAGALAYLRGEGRLALIPSLADNLPNTVLECLGARTPFLASNVGGIPEMVAAEDVELTCFPNRAAAFADKLREAVKHGVRPARPAVDPAANQQAWLDWHARHVGTPASALGGVTVELSQPLVSVCLSHFNRPTLLRQALASVEAQDYPNIEVVLVDDASTAPEAIACLDELAPTFAQRRWQIIRNQQEMFVGAARNLAARHARGEFLMFMDDDNCAKPHEVSTFVRVARKAGADIVSCALDFFSGADAPGPSRLPNFRFPFLGPAAAAGALRNYFGDTNSLFRREVFLALGGFHEERHVGHEDWEIIGDAVLKGYRLEAVPEALVWYRRNESGQNATAMNWLHGGHMRNIRPYLDAVPAALRNLVLFAQGQMFRVADGAMGESTSPLYVENTIRWRAKAEAARALFALKQKDAAAQMLLEGVKAVEQSRHPRVVLEGLLEIGREFKSIEPRRAQQLLQLALQLATNTKNEPGKRAAEALLESLPHGTKIASPDSMGVPSPSPQPFTVKTPLTRPAGTLSPSEGERAGVRGNETRPPTEINPPDAVSFKVSIIIPTFNNLPLTRQCLDALGRHSPPGTYEIIVVDNGSNDGTREFLRAQEKLGALRACFNEKNLGFARACNQGAQTARGEWLLFLNNDTLPTPGWLDALLAASQRPEVGVVGAKLLYPDGRVQHAGIGFLNGIPDHPHRFAAADATEVNQFRELDMVTAACLLVSRSVFLHLRGFDEVFQNGVEDIDLCLRVRATGQKVVYEPKAVLHHLEGQTSGRGDHVKENLRRFFARWKGRFDAQQRFILPSTGTWQPSEKSCLPAQPAVTVAWEGSFLDLGSLSHVNRELTRQLARQPGIEVARVGKNSLPAAAAQMLALQECAQQLRPAAPSHAAVTVRHLWPPRWDKPAHGAWVVIQPWEFGALPAEWLARLTDVDEVWAPSEYVRRVYVDSGVNAAKVKVVPNGIDPQRFHPEAPPLPLATKKAIKFLFVGGTIHRKGPDVLLKAYLESFRAGDDVCLVIKDFGGQSIYAGQTLEGAIRAAQADPTAPEILYLTEELPPEALPGLYTACDCLVHPYRGEGFGLPVLEAMACGLPVIVTGGGATDDFAGDEYAYRLPAQRRWLDDEVDGLKLAQRGWLLEPDPAALAKRMRGVFERRDEAKAKGRAASGYVRREWTWERAAQIAARRLHDLRARRQAVATAVPATRAPRETSIKLPEVARVGQLSDARSLLGRKQLVEAWQATLEALEARPFHPEAWLLLAEIAQAAGDLAKARACAEQAKRLASAWKPAQKFLKALPAKAQAARVRLPELPPRFTPHASRLTVCLIVKNEERFLGRCLESIRSVADQIVVVDTGSTDWTKDIAARFGAEVYAFEWCDDFSAARNAALAHTRGDWVLILDADEELRADSLETLKQEMANDKVIAYRLPIVDVGREEEGCSYVPRLFRNAPGLFFVGRVHEQVFASVEVRRAAWGLENRLGQSTLLHHGYTAELTQQRNKAQRNLALVEKALEELPDEPHLRMSYGLELMRAGQKSAGLEQYRRAFELCSALPATQVVPETRETLLTQFTTHLMAERDFEGIVHVLQSPLAKAGGLTASLHFALGLALMELQRFDEAAQQFRQCLAKRHQPALSPINRDIRRAAPNHCLALCLAKLRQSEAAAQAFCAALADEPESRPVRLDYAKFLAEAGQPVEGLKLLHQLVSEQATDLPVWLLGGQLALSRPEFLEFACDWTREAEKQFPDEPRVLAQRAEALLLNQEIQSALPLWRRCLAPSANEMISQIMAHPFPTAFISRAEAALVLCQLLCDEECAGLGAPSAESLPGGARPSSGAETRARQTSLERSSAPGIAQVAAPEDGRAPLNTSGTEAAVSQEFLKLYRRLLNFGAAALVQAVNAKLDRLRAVLPSAGQTLERALAEAAREAAV